MPEIFIQTRITPPKPSGKIIHRKRLFNLLEDNSDKNLILICASAGFGKTTLTHDFVSQSERKYAWYYVTSDINNPYSFYKYIIFSLKKLKKNFGNETLHIIDSIEKDFTISKNFATYIEDVTATFINEFVSHFPDDVFLIIDDLHNIDSIESGEWLSYLFRLLFENIPSNLHLIVTTREKPGFDLSKLSAKRKMFELTTDDLVFDTEEISQLLENIYSLDITEDEIKILKVNLNGWVTGIHLLLQAYGKDFSKIHFGDKLQYSDIFKYFANDIFEKLEEKTRTFLLNTALLENFDSEFCDRFLEIDNSKNIIAHLLNKNIFITPTKIISLKNKNNGSYSVYNYQELFKLFLISKLYEMSSEEEINRIKRKLFKLYLDLNDIVQAITFGILAKDYSNAIPLLINNFDSLFHNGFYELLWKWIVSLPGEIMNSDPNLLYDKGLLCLYFHSEREESLKYLSDAIKILENGDNPDLLAECYLSRTDGLLLAGKISELKEELHYALTLDTKEENKAKILISLARLEYREGYTRYESAVELLNEALEICNEEKLESIRTEIYRVLGNIYSDWGNLLKAIYYYEQALNIDIDIYRIFRVMFNVLIKYCYIGNFMKAKEYIDKITELYKSYPSNLFERYILKSTAIFKFECADYEDCIKNFKKLNTLEIKHKIKQYEATNLIDIGEAYYYLKKYDLAIQNLDMAKDNIEKGNEYHMLINEYLKIIISTRINIHQDIEQVLLRVLDFHEKNNILQQKVQIEFNIADYYLRCGMNDSASKYLNNCLRVSADRQFISFLEQEILNSRSVFDFALINPALSIHKDFIKTLFENVKSRLEYNFLSDECRKRFAVQIEELNDIRMFSFGRLEFLLRGKTIGEEKWIRKKSKLILAYLLAKPKSVLTKDQIIDMFFQDVPLENADTVYHNTLSNMRIATKIVYDFASVEVRKNSKNKKDKVTDWSPSLLVYEDKVLRLNPDFYFKSDNIEFEDLSRKASKIGIKSETKIGFLKQAIELYKGEFLPGYYDNWCEEMRLNYANMYIKLCSKLIESLKEQKLYNEVITYTENLLKVDKLNEEAYIDLIDSYVQLDNINMAKDEFSLMLKIFEEELGEKPHKFSLEKIKKILTL
jgi:LuxR family maltose regulon positive regulatory protein